MSEKHFIMAKLSLPIEVKNGSDFKLYRDKLTIEFDNCLDLPDDASKSDLDVIYRIFPSMRPEQQPENTEELKVDIKPIMVQLNRSKGFPKVKNRMTFKRYPKIQRFTRRRYSKESDKSSD
tara:strand:+ start:745 stop:1107 length:363 start_codon:yes stop_codon:yes gene_type:complete